MEAQQPAAAGGQALPRRRFLRYVLGFAALSTVAIVATPIVGFLVPPRTTTTSAGGRVKIGTLADVAVGQGIVVPVGSSPAIVVNTEQGLKAFSAICTHLGCVVGWDGAAGNIVCPCHDGRFNPTTGAVLAGPPPQPLPALPVVVEGDEIFIVSG